MKTKNFLIALALMVSGTVLYGQTMEVNTEKSSIEWLGKKIGGKHDGFIQLKSASFEMEGKQ